MRPGPQPCDRRGFPPLQIAKDPRFLPLAPVSPLFPADPRNLTPKSFISRTSKTKDFKSFISHTYKEYRGVSPYLAFRPTSARIETWYTIRLPLNLAACPTRYSSTSQAQSRPPTPNRFATILLVM